MKLFHATRYTKTGFFGCALLLTVFFACTRAKQQTRPNEAEMTEWAKERIADSVQAAENLGQPELAIACGRARVMLDTWGAAAITCTPYLFRATVHTHRLSGRRLHVEWLERQADVKAVRIREYWVGGAHIDETFELPTEEKENIRKTEGATFVHARALGVKDRPAHSVRAQSEDMMILTSEDAAEEGLSQKAVGLPRVLMAAPSEKVVVLVSLIDEVGHESQAVAAVSMLTSEDEDK